MAIKPRKVYVERDNKGCYFRVSATSPVIKDCIFHGDEQRPLEDQKAWIYCHTKVWPTEYKSVTFERIGNDKLWMRVRLNGLQLNL